MIAKFRVYERSMMPHFPEGSLLLAEKISYIFRNPRIGEVVIIKTEGINQLKRVIQIDGDQLTLAGDNELESISAFRERTSNVVGRVFKKL